MPVEITATAAGGGTVKHTLNKEDTWDKLAPEIQAELEQATGLTHTADPDNFKEMVDAYLKGQKYDADGKPTIAEENLTPRGIFDGNVLFSNDGDTNDTSNITALNISISRAWKDNPVLVRDFECPVGEIGRAHV